MFFISSRSNDIIASAGFNSIRAELSCFSSKAQFEQFTLFSTSEHWISLRICCRASLILFVAGSYHHLKSLLFSYPLVFKLKQVCSE